MAKSYANAKRRRENGAFVALPYAVLRHQNYISLSPRAVKLLVDLCAQINRGAHGTSNNGDQTTAWATISKQGWTSRDQVFKAQQELEAKGFILRTRQGGRHQCNLFAITFYAIDECDGKLDVPATTTAPGTWNKN